MNASHRVAILSILSSLLISGMSIAQDTCTWNNSTGDWSTGTSWSCGHEPGSLDAVIINGGTVTTTSAAAIASYTQSGGTLTGAGDLTVTGAMSWTGGVIGGTGLLTTEQAVTFSSVTLDGRIWTMAGGGTWTVGDLIARSGSSVVVPSSEVLTITAPGYRMHDGGTSATGVQLTVEGTLVGNGVSETVIQVETALDGPVDVQQGGLQFARTTTYTPSTVITMASGTFVRFNGGTHAVTGVSISGSGSLVQNSGSVTFSGGTTVGLPVQLLGGTLTLTESVTIPGYTQSGGTLTGAGDLTVTGAMSWTGGVIGGTGLLTTEQAVTFSTVTLDGRIWTMAGGGTWTVGDLIARSGSSVVVPSSEVLTITAPGYRMHDGGTSATGVQLTVEGTLVGNGVSETVIQVETALDGPVDVQQGGLQFARTTTYTPSTVITMASGTFVRFNGGTHAVTGVSISGSGSLVQNSGSVTFSGGTTVGLPVQLLGGTLTLTESVTIPGYTQSGGTLTGAGDLTVTGAMSWTGGVIGGTGLLTTEQAVTFSTVTLDGRIWTMAGGGTWTVGDLIARSGSSVVVPSSEVLTITAPGYRMHDGGTSATGVQLTVEGTLVGNGVSETVIQVETALDGPVDVQQGGLQFARTTTYTPSTVITMASGTFVRFNGGTHAVTGVSISGSGSLVQNSGSVTFSGGTTVGLPVQLLGGTLTLTESVTIPGYTQSGGTLTGAGDLTVTGAMSWTGGVIGGTGLLTTEQAVTFSSVTLDGRIWTMAGGGTWTVGDLIARSGSSVVVPSSEVLTITAPGYRMHDGGTSATGVQLTVEGTLVRNGASTTVVQVEVDNPGVMRFVSGGVAFQRAVNSTGRVEGTSTVDFQTASLTNAGTFAPGVSAGILTYSGNYSNSNLEIELAGNAVGTEYDQLTVSGQAALGGTLEVLLLDSFVPANGNEYQILTASNVTGTFDTLVLPDLGADTEMIVEYGPTEVRLVVTGANNAPVAVADVATTDEDNAVTIDVLANDSDADGDSLTINRITMSPEHGTAEIQEGTVVYAPAANYNGPDSLVYVVRDVRGAEATASVNVTVTSVNDAPTAAALQTPPDAATFVIQGQPANPFLVTWSGSSDVEGDAVTYTWQLATSIDFTSIIVESETGSTTEYQTTFGDLATLLTANGVSVSETTTLYHRVVSSDGTDDTNGGAFSIVLTRGSIVGVEDESEIPTKFALYGNYPNPFNPTTSVKFDLPSNEQVSLTVYDALGKKVAVLISADLAAGAHEAVFDARGLSSGLYVYRIAAGSFVQTRTMVLLK